MRRFAMVTGLTVGLGLALSTGLAQVGQMGLMVRGGVFFPTSKPAQDLGERWFTAGVEYELFKLRTPGIPVDRSAISISVDVYSKSGGTSVPVLLNYVGYSGRFHYSAGGGVAFADRPDFDNATRFGYQVSIGYDVVTAPTPVTLEVRYRGVVNFKNFLDGLTATVGIRL